MEIIVLAGAVAVCLMLPVHLSMRLGRIPFGLLLAMTQIMRAKRRQRPAYYSMHERNRMPHISIVTRYGEVHEFYPPVWVSATAGFLRDKLSAIRHWFVRNFTFARHTPSPMATISGEIPC